MNKSIISIASILAVVALAGCTSTKTSMSSESSKASPNGIVFQKAQPGQSLLYVYREYNSAGLAVFFDIHDTSAGQDRVIGTLSYGTALSSNLTPGSHEIWARTEAKESINIDIASGETKCIKGTVGLGIVVGRPHFEEVELSVCEAEINQIRETETKYKEHEEKIKKNEHKLI